MIIVTGLAFVLGLGLQIWLESGLGTELLGLGLGLGLGLL